MNHIFIQHREFEGFSPWLHCSVDTSGGSVSVAMGIDRYKIWQVDGIANGGSEDDRRRFTHLSRCLLTFC
jgi:hypothetical protein